LVSASDETEAAKGALRVAVIGEADVPVYQYKMDLVDGPANHDILVQSANVSVVVDQNALFRERLAARLQRRPTRADSKSTNPNAVHFYYRFLTAGGVTDCFAVLERPPLAGSDQLFKEKQQELASAARRIPVKTRGNSELQTI